MEILKYILLAIDMVVCLALIVTIMRQKSEDGGASGTIVGASASNFYEKNKGRTQEAKIKKLTVALFIVFIVLTIVLGIIYAV